MTAPSQPEIFGPYLVHERLGAGGMATVHRAIKTGMMQQLLTGRTRLPVETAA